MTTRLKITVETQGCIWPNLFVVTACQPNLVVVMIDTQQKYVECSSDVYGRGQAIIQLYPGERTLHLRRGRGGGRLRGEGANADASTFIRVKGLANSTNWRSFAEGGRYTCTATFYRLDPKRTHKQFEGST